MNIMGLGKQHAHITCGREFLQHIGYLSASAGFEYSRHHQIKSRLVPKFHQVEK